MNRPPRSVLRTARLHRERNRADRRQHSSPMTFKEKLRACVHDKHLPGYHECICTACGTMRVWRARTAIGLILDDFTARTGQPNFGGIG